MRFAIPANGPIDNRFSIPNFKLGNETTQGETTMSDNRIYYLRNDRNTAHGGRGEPVAVIVTKIDRTKDVIRYAVATVHPNDSFNKVMARHIATERLEGKDRRGKPKSLRRGNGASEIPGVPATGHEITRLVMQDICSDEFHPVRVRDLANEWLDNADRTIHSTGEGYACNDEVRSASEVPTLPAPPSTETPKHRDALPPPPMMPRLHLHRSSGTVSYKHEQSNAKP